jgi:GT2 family glycosyltransferase
MKLSIVIVNYNVKFFLDQCLTSVKKAISQFETYKPEYKAEVIVVDNNSVDSSRKLLQEKHNWVKTVFNKKNLGFSAANNQAIEISTGEYVLLLNPDTVVEENTFIKTIDYLDRNSDVGGLGVKMIDGKGHFLPESKRGFPSPLTAFYKISGLSSLFPKSKKFGIYHLGFLKEDEINEIDVLSGAFTMLRKSVLNEIGLLDDQFFMYGEDIDLSYRIKKAGYKNVYFPETQIIHYKGESTKKGSLNYVVVFYKAMAIFAKKHFSKTNASLFVLFINVAIYLRAFISILKRFFEKISLPLLDYVLVFSGLLLSKVFWENNQQIGHGVPYPKEIWLHLFPIYTFLWVIGLWLTKNYRPPFKSFRIINGILLGTLLISTLYAFLNESFRFSRAIIVIGTITSLFAPLISRVLYNLFLYKKPYVGYKRKNKVAIVGNPKEAERVLDIISRSSYDFSFMGFISPSEEKIKEKDYIGEIFQVEEIIEIHHVNELIFCAKDISSEEIISQMSTIKDKDITFKIAPQEALFIIGSNDKNTSGDFYTIGINLSISKKENLSKKRLFEFFISLGLLFVFWVILPFQKNKKTYFKNILCVLRGNKHLVSYDQDIDLSELPKIKKGLFSVSNQIKKEIDNEKKRRLNYLYARDYSIKLDFQILFKNLRYIGGKS